jgi:triosephosphate isomerase
MSSKKFLIAANWKMFAAPQNLHAYQSKENVDVVIFPMFLDIKKCLDAKLTVGAQYGHPEESGAHTGDISMAMVKNLGCNHVLCGHSERRRDHKESNEFVAAQVVSALQHGLHPILCIGETWEERKAGKSKEIVKTQLEAVLSILGSISLDTPSPRVMPSAPSEQRERGVYRGTRGLGTRDDMLTIAYEPVWAISGGDPNKPAATASDAQGMHAYIRNLLTTNYSLPTLRIIYGGSMKPENAEELLNQPDIDGGLVGNASLDPQKFQSIVEIAGKIH